MLFSMHMFLFIKLINITGNLNGLMLTSAGLSFCMLMSKSISLDDKTFDFFTCTLFKIFTSTLHI